MSLASEFAVRRSVVVALPKPRAFEVFVNMTGWWPLGTHTVGEAPAQALIVEARVGGRWFSIDKFGDEDDIGRVLLYDPPGRIVLTWELSHDFRYETSFATELEVRFVAESPERTSVELEHRHFESYGPRWEDQLELFAGDGAWTYVLRCYAAAASQGRQEV
jgi:uncharacterized protein YndB with AHSA1/START domain